MVILIVGAGAASTIVPAKPVESHSYCNRRGQHWNIRRPGCHLGRRARGFPESSGPWLWLRRFRTGVEHFGPQSNRSAAQRVRGRHRGTRNCWLSRYWLRCCCASFRLIVGLVPPLRSIWAVSLATWLVGSMSINWQYGKVTWLLFVLLAVHSAAQSAAVSTIGINPSQ